MDVREQIVHHADGRTLLIEEGGDPTGRPVLVHAGTPQLAPPLRKLRERRVRELLLVRTRRRADWAEAEFAADERRGPAEITVAREGGRVLQDALYRLDEDLRRAVMADVADLGEVAEALGVTRNCLHSMRHRVLLSLSEDLELQEWAYANELQAA
jgi:hypothetical protein